MSWKMMSRAGADQRPDRRIEHVGDSPTGTSRRLKFFKLRELPGVPVAKAPYKRNRVNLKLLDQLPIYPMFGRGRTRLQPVYVEDVAEAIARALPPTGTDAITLECGGPRVYSYEELLRAVAHEAKIQPILIPIPFAAWARLGLDR